MAPAGPDSALNGGGRPHSRGAALWPIGPRAPLAQDFEERSFATAVTQSLNGVPFIVVVVLLTRLWLSLAQAALALTFEFLSA